MQSSPTSKTLLSKKNLLLFILLMLAFSVSRLYALSADIPIWSISHYSPIDEFYYTPAAFDVVEGIHSPSGTLLSPPYSAYNMVEQFITAGSLLLFGDNYFGLRLPSVLAGMIVLACFYTLILKRFGLLSAVLFCTVLISELSFTLATRIAEPTIFRMAAAAVILLVFAHKNYTARSHIFMLGIAISIAWLFIYPTNAFLGLFALIVLLAGNLDKPISSTATYAIGALVGACIYLLCFYALGHSISDFLTTKSILSGRIADERSNVFVQMVLKILAIRNASFFSSHVYFLIASIISLAVLTLLAFFNNRRVTHIDKVVLVFVLCFLLQCAFINDYPERKLVFILPVCLYLCLFLAHLLLDRLPRIYSTPLLVGTALTTATLFAIPTFKNVYAAPQYSYQNAMKDLTFLNGQRVIGGWSYGFRLYNDYKPYLNQYALVYTQSEYYYRQLTDAGRRNEALYTFEYGDEKAEHAMNAAGFYKERVIFRTNDPVYPDMYLYKFNALSTPEPEPHAEQDAR
ncbi:glycosyltransferase family 39 protein [Pseudomonas sp. NPDC089554]|uniref:glycosyltransferase family 39 protein n=1 Tax=Pseudomonas sp. NPDC089554 TaxID=3390653 RepID=UPI003D02E350